MTIYFIPSLATQQRNNMNDINQIVTGSSTSEGLIRQGKDAIHYTLFLVFIKTWKILFFHKSNFYIKVSHLFFIIECLIFKHDNDK